MQQKMNRARALVALAATLLAAAAPVARAGSSDSPLFDNKNCVNADGNVFDDAIDYFPSAFQLHDSSGKEPVESVVEIAQNFRVSYHGYYKVVKHQCFSGNGASASCTPQTYVLTMCGAPKPDVDADGNAWPAAAKHFEVPLKGVAFSLTVVEPFMEMLNLRHKVKMVDHSYSHSPCIQRDEEIGAIDGQDSSLYPVSFATPAAWNDKINGGVADIDAVFTDSWNTGAASDASKNVVFDASTDPGILNRGEWIKFMGVFFNEEQQANAYFERELAAFNRVESLAHEARWNNRLETGTVKTCAWIAKEKDYSAWPEPATDVWKLKYDQYKQDLCVSAGLTPTMDAGANEQTFANATLLATKIANVDVVFDETYDPDPTTYTKDAAFAALGFLESDLKSSVLFLRTDYHVSDTTTGDSLPATRNVNWLAEGVGRPATVLADLVARVWPDDFETPVKGCPRYFRDMRLSSHAPQVVGAAACEAWTRANEDKLCITSSYGPESSVRLLTLVNIAIVCAAGLVFMMCVAASFKLCRRRVSRSNRLGDAMLRGDDDDARAPSSSASASASSLPPPPMVPMLPGMVPMLPAYPSPASAAKPSGSNNPFKTLGSAPGPRAADGGGSGSPPTSNGSHPPMATEV